MTYIGVEANVGGEFPLLFIDCCEWGKLTLMKLLPFK